MRAWERIPYIRKIRGEELSRALGTRLLGRIPLDPRISESNDKGASLIDLYPESPVSREIVRIAMEIGGAVSKA